MSTSAPSRTPAPRPAAEPATPHRRGRTRIPAPRRRFVSLAYGWPLTWLFCGFGLWWALGLSELAIFVFAVPMLVQLHRRKTPIRFPRGFGLWAVFIVWGLVSIVMIDVIPPETLPSGIGGRMIAAGFRTCAYLSAAIVVVYVLNLDRRLYSQRRIARVLGVGFVWVAIGGWLGLVAPTFEFTSPVELLLPQGLRADGFVRSFIHPAAAQVQDFLGYEVARPAAPFGYTNNWGHAFAMLLPWFVVGFVVKGRGPMRWLAAAFAVVSLVPAIASLNRGLWVGLALMVVCVAIKAVVVGRPGLTVGIAAAGVIAVGAVLVSPLSSLVEERLDNGHSDDIRAFTTERALELGELSPIIGLGGTRTAYGSSSSIAVGNTPECTNCGNTTIGINGQLWFEIVGHGYVGAALYVAMFVSLLWFFRSNRTAVGTAAQIGLVSMLWFMFSYPALIMPLTVAFIGWAVLWRDARPEAADAEPAHG